VLSKERLIDAIWRDTFVGDDVLVRCISEIRYVFGDDARSPYVIQTIPKAGYRLIASVTMELATAAELRTTADTAVRSSGSHTIPERRRDSGINAVDLDDLPRPGDLDAAQAAEDPIAVEPAPSVYTVHAHEESSHPTAPPRRNRRTLWLLLTAAALGLVAWGAPWYWRSLHPDPFNIFWAPVLATPEPALFCIADQNQYSFITLRDAADPTKKVVLKDNLSAVVIDDLDTIVRVAATLHAHGKQYHLKGEEATTLSDLRNGPSIFIGAFDNAWTLRLTKSLRYHFANNADMTQFHIVDGNDPSHPGWVVDRNQQMTTNNYLDYGIVARFTDANTGKPSIIVAGIGRGGTIAAGEFLTNPDDLAQLRRAMQSADSKKNLEIVLSTQIIDGQPGTPKMEASYFW
jgi:hypothetical protein